jgi:hypothetical protein
MAGICSAHHPDMGPVEGCAACHATPHDLFPDWDEAVARAEAAGTAVCACGFEFYRTVDFCPKCGAEAPPETSPGPA